MKKTIISIFLLVTSISFFNGCSRYYVTLPEKNNIPKQQQKIPVHIEIMLSGSNYIFPIDPFALRKNVRKVIAQSSVFQELDSSENKMSIKIQQANEEREFSRTGAALTGLSLGVISNKGHSNIDIDITIGNNSNIYYGEYFIGQGIGGDALIDKTKYTEEEPQNLMNVLIKNALDEFTIVYLKNQLKNSMLSLGTETTK